MAFYVVGLPGIALALFVKATLKEPPRGWSEGTHKIIVEPPPFKQVLKNLFAKKSFRHLSFAAGLHAFVSYGVGTFYASYLGRTHGMSISEISQWLAFSVAIGGFLGTYYGGAISDRYYAKNPDVRYYLWIPAITLILNVPFGLVVFGVDNKQIVLYTLVPMIALSAAYLAPSIATTHRLVGLRERAVSGAVLLFVLNLIGLGLGPVFTGKLSDLFRQHLVGQGMAEAQATADGLQWALCIAIAVNLWSALHYWLATKTLREDIAEGERARSIPPGVPA
jgi:MFS family permease